MARSAYARFARPLAAALGAGAPVFAQRVHCDDKPKPDFLIATCTKNEAHTRDTRLITFSLPEKWIAQGPIGNVLVRATIQGAAESGCCACCKCPPPCGCPKQANGCCACCKCPGTCGCPKKVVQAAGDSAASSVVARPYNPLSADSGDSITLLVKRYAGGQMGTKLHELKVGETVEVKPRRQWTLETGKYKHVAMVAGGTGITPLVQAAEYLLRHDAASVTMLTFNKSSEDVLLREHLSQLQAAFPKRFKLVHVVESGASSREREGSATAAPLLKEALPAPGPGVLVMVCGRKEMTEAVAGPKTPDFKQGEVGGILKELGYTSDQVWKV